MSHRCYMFVQSVLGKNCANSGHAELYKQPCRVRQNCSDSDDEEPGIGQSFQRQPNLRCSPTWALISVSEATSAVEKNISLKYNLFHTSELVTWTMTYSIFTTESFWTLPTHLTHLPLKKCSENSDRYKVKWQIKKERIFTWPYK